jgi:catechol 2,3-dioxygenase-like lactoylglutathione lyase family enzyme
VSAIHHIEITVSDPARSAAFYRALLLALDWRELHPGAYVKDGCEIHLKRGDAAPGRAFGPRHVCFRAASRDVVDRVGGVLRAAGAVVLRGPQPMPQYSPTYYTVDVRDPDGFVLEVAHV